MEPIITFNEKTHVDENGNNKKETSKEIKTSRKDQIRSIWRRTSKMRPEEEQEELLKLIQSITLSSMEPNNTETITAIFHNTKLPDENSFEYIWYRYKECSSLVKIQCEEKSSLTYQPTIDDVGYIISFHCRSLRYHTIWRCIETSPVTLAPHIHDTVKLFLDAGYSSFAASLPGLSGETFQLKVDRNKFLLTKISEEESENGIICSNNYNKYAQIRICSNDNKKFILTNKENGEIIIREKCIDDHNYKFLSEALGDNGEYKGIELVTESKENRDIIAIVLRTFRKESIQKEDDDFAVEKELEETTDKSVVELLDRDNAPEEKESDKNVQEIKEQLHRYILENAMLHGKLEESSSFLNEYKARSASLTAALGEKSTELVNANKKIKELTEQNSVLENEIKTKSHDLTELRSKLSTLKNEKKKYLQEKAKAEIVFNEIRDENIEMKLENEELKTSLKHYTERSASLEQENIVKTTELNSLKNKVQSLKKEIKDLLGNKFSSVDNTVLDPEALRIELSMAKANEKMLQDDNKEYQLAIDFLIDQLPSVRSKDEILSKLELYRQNVEYKRVSSALTQAYLDISRGGSLASTPKSSEISHSFAESNTIFSIATLHNEPNEISTLTTLNETVEATIPVMHNENKAIETSTSTSEPSKNAE